MGLKMFFALWLPIVRIRFRLVYGDAFLFLPQLALAQQAVAEILRNVSNATATYVELFLYTYAIIFLH